MTETTTLPYVLDAQVGYLLRQVSQRHVQIFLDMAPDGLTPTQFSALVRLAEVGPTSQNRLGRMTSMDVATIKGVVERLAIKGLVHLGADPQDKRRTTISLTEEGRRLIPDLHNIGHRVTEATLAPLSQQDRATLVGILSRLA